MKRLTNLLGALVVCSVCSACTSSSAPSAPPPQAPVVSTTQLTAAEVPSHAEKQEDAPRVGKPQQHDGAAAVRKDLGEENADKANPAERGNRNDRHRSTGFSGYK
jgi:hypothetical protein